MRYSRIYTVRLSHSRHYPVKHTFNHSIAFFCLDLDELFDLEASLILFGYNKFNVFSLHDKDYLDVAQGSIKEKLLHFLEEESCSKGVSRIELVTVPKYFGYVFNPVSFYICYGSGKNIYCVLAEVSNTFKERHLYILKESQQIDTKWDFKASTAKQFFVSPFNNISGKYEFLVAINKNVLDIGINLINTDGKCILATRMQGNATPLAKQSLYKTLMFFPFSSLLTMSRITIQGIKLRSKSLKRYLKPNSQNKRTIRKVVKIPFHRKLYVFMSRMKKILKT